MKLGSCIHLEELRSILCSILRLDLRFRFTDKCRVFAFGSFSQTIRARAMELGSCIHLEEIRLTLCSILRFDLL